MTQEKMRKVITASVVAGTVLLVILLSVLIYGWVKIGVLNRREKALEAETTALEELNRDEEANAAWYEGPGQLWLAYEKGWVYEQGDK
jgi:hypothetical protein